MTDTRTADQLGPRMTNPMVLMSGDGARHEVLEANCYSFQGYVTWCSLHGSSKDRAETLAEAYARRDDHLHLHEQARDATEVRP